MRPENDPAFWRGQLSGRTRPRAETVIRAPRERARSSGAGAFLALGANGNQYWVKVPNNGQGSQVLVNEVIVGEVGKLIGAPVRERVLVTVPPGVTTWSDFPVAASSVPLLAHGSLHVPHAVDDDELTYTRRDDNARRQAAMLGLWDLCVGEDPQWLYETTAAYSVWSYDHGLWFATGEGDWDAAVLNKLLHVDASFPHPPKGISVRALRETATRISSLTSGELLTAMSAVPVEWGTGDEDLEAMAWFLFSRREPVAHRLNKLAAAASG
ncbi:hypothetical protein GCM10022240_27180 [Microbacterium kribbense]|uniref:Uncharacterized protein n=1 Tax=Microbacterium kribbense TaxID=433645 RepID=A0ABP7GTM4_9MICO